MRLVSCREMVVCMCVCNQGVCFIDTSRSKTQALRGVPESGGGVCPIFRWPSGLVGFSWSQSSKADLVSMGELLMPSSGERQLEKSKLLRLVFLGVVLSDTRA